VEKEGWKDIRNQKKPCKSKTRIKKGRPDKNFIIVSGGANHPREKGSSLSRKKKRDSFPGTSKKSADSDTYVKLGKENGP